MPAAALEENDGSLSEVRYPAGVIAPRERGVPVGHVRRGDARGGARRERRIALRLQVPGGGVIAPRERSAPVGDVCGADAGGGARGKDRIALCGQIARSAVVAPGVGLVPAGNVLGGDRGRRARGVRGVAFDHRGADLLVGANVVDAVCEVRGHALEIGPLGRRFGRSGLAGEEQRDGSQDDNARNERPPRHSPGRNFLSRRKLPGPPVASQRSIWPATYGPLRAMSDVSTRCFFDSRYISHQIPPHLGSSL